jgi:hypothetical protein
MLTRTARAVLVTTLTAAMLGAGATTALADVPDDPYCDVLLPVLRDLGYAGEDPRCTA